MEFKEFSNPLEEDYDITSSLKNNDDPVTSKEDYGLELMNLIGILEDVTSEDLEREFGITLEEYEHPTKEVVERVKTNLGTKGYTK